jgi:hypothetical protein
LSNITPTSHKRSLSMLSDLSCASAWLAMICCASNNGEAFIEASVSKLI